LPVFEFSIAISFALEISIANLVVLVGRVSVDSKLGCSNLRRLSIKLPVLLDPPFLTVFLRFLMLLFELSQSFRQITYLTEFPTACLLPGLLNGVEGLHQPVLGAAVLLKPTTLCGIVGRE
jgi:hypothetical protein